MKFSYSLIKKLAPKAPPKQKLIEGLNLRAFEAENGSGDAFEVAIPPNRYSDAASHVGIAREVGAIFSAKAKNPVKTIINPPENKGFIKLDIKDAKLCPRYAARYFELKHPVGSSPKWMQEVLLSCGLKPINAVVDIMNYAMLETGQPLHAFDADKLAKSKAQRANRVEISVRRAKNGERIKTLDGRKFALDSDILVIADKEKSLAIAGIKGGDDSGVTEKTRRIIVESANFNPVFIYRAARKLKLQTDASARFGHGLSPSLVSWGLDRATELLLKSGAWLLDTVDYYPKQAGDGIIEFDCAKYESVVGAPVDAKRAEKYFTALGFGLEKVSVSPLSGAGVNSRQSAMRIRIPSWRSDVEQPEDLIEEVARLEGYGKFKPKAPVVAAVPAREEDVVTLKDKIRAVLVGMQIDEVYNSSFVGAADFSRTEKFSADYRGYFGANQSRNRRESALVAIENPITEDKRFLRLSLTPLLLKNTESNARFYNEIRIFEIGKIFSRGKRGVEEGFSLGVVLAAKNGTKLILEMKGVADELMRGLGIDDFTMVAAGEFIRVEVDNRVLGILGYGEMDKGWHAAFGEFDLEKAMQFTEEAKEFIPIKRFPAIVRDMSILVAEDVRIGDVVREMQLVNQKLIENVDLIDEYMPSAKDNIGENRRAGRPRSGYGEAGQREPATRRSLTFRIIFQSENRTLTDEEVNAEMEKITAALKKEFKAEVR